MRILHTTRPRRRHSAEPAERAGTFPGVAAWGSWEWGGSGQSMWVDAIIERRGWRGHWQKVARVPVVDVKLTPDGIDVYCAPYLSVRDGLYRGHGVAGCISPGDSVPRGAVFTFIQHVVIPLTALHASHDLP